MKNIVKALDILGIDQYVLRGSENPTTKEQFKDFFSKIIGKDHNNIPIESKDENEWGFTWEELVDTLPTAEKELKLDEIRLERDKLLSETDWWALSDRVMTEQQIQYRQELRDITSTYSSLKEVIWPEKP